MKNEIQVLDQNEIALAFNSDQGIQAIIDSIKSQVNEKFEGVVWDFSKKKDRDTVASLAYKIGRSKTAIDAEGKKLKEQYTVFTKKIDAERKLAREQLEAEQARIRKPLDDWEQAEKDRVTELQNRVNQLTQQFGSMISSDIKADIERIKSIEIDDSFMEFKDKAKLAKFETLELLGELLTQAEKQEAEQAELEKQRIAEQERLQREHDERVAREAANKARFEAEQKAKEEAERVNREKQEAAEREARLKAEKEAALLREEQLKQQAIEREKQAEIDRQNAIEQERLRIEREQIAKAEAERKAEEARLANVEHMRSINNEILNKLCEVGLDEDQAKSVITAIAKNQIPNVTIKY